jgi:hypothetical protein
MEILSGVGIGLLVGVLIGMSTSEVVGTVVAALTALLAAYFGLTGSKAGTGEAGGGRLARIAAFGIAAVIGVVGGLYARTHGILGRSVAEHVSEWQEAGYDSIAARHLVVYERTGLIPPDWGAEQAGEPNRGQSPYLFAEAVGKCDQIVPENYRSPWSWPTRTFGRVKAGRGSRAPRRALLRSRGGEYSNRPGGWYAKSDEGDRRHGGGCRFLPRTFRQRTPGGAALPGGGSRVRGQGQGERLCGG